ncbi:hypothetical protein [Jatrophihabitans lederbergiae]|uniref:Uncharacterized protein n=1 Tax=Jatrophihabitans lederbergiae TaxID=3075547 RepID=A0ABU2J885_9ACTN|nr:hypothetical protein [Jatrophihabitans sp. DSM 44399]MDT0261197.1 hypothetical protein [Jatrophihabitans sp. DSM 44399]
MSEPTSSGERPDPADEDDMRQHTQAEAEGSEPEEGPDVPRVHTQDPAEG